MNWIACWLGEMFSLSNTGLNAATARPMLACARLWLYCVAGASKNESSKSTGISEMVLATSELVTAVTLNANSGADARSISSNRIRTTLFFGTLSIIAMIQQMRIGCQR